MAQRLTLLKNHLVQKTNYVSSSLEYMRFTDFLTKEEEEIRKKVRLFLEQEIAPQLPEYIEKAQFPEYVLAKMRSVQFFDLLLPKPFGKGHSHTLVGVLIAEAARIDAGLATFIAVQWGLAIDTIIQLGSEEQQQKYVNRMKNLELLSGWGLTEQKIGSDASNLETTATKVAGGYRINGDKRWIGNGNRDILLCWAKNTENKKVECFIVDMKSEGVTTQVIKHKLALRIVQNCQIHFNNVFVPDSDRLPKATNFQQGTNKVLKHSRTLIPWVAVGTAMGVYDNAIKYAQNRKQFGVPISSYQLQQEKFARIMGNLQAMILMSWRATTLYEDDKSSMGHIAMVKAWTSLRLREVAQLGREIMGGNGIIHDNYCIKAVADAEAIYSYEGTYDINSLLVGRELTGISAFTTHK